jgi:hypothetical protein
MPIVGRKPKPEGQARNRNKPTHDWIEVVDVPYAGERPDLPKKRAIMTPFGPKEVALQPLTRRWWEAVSRMPHCARWTPSDWMFAVATAIVADAAFCGGVGAATELRNRERKMGVTADDRVSLRIRYVEAAGDDLERPADVVALDDYRDL